MKFLPRFARPFRQITSPLQTLPIAAGLLMPGGIAAQSTLVQAQAAPVLSFNLTAQVSSRTSSGSTRPTRSASTKVMTRAGRVRVESKVGGTPVVGLYAPPYIYRLLPNTKSGTRYRIRHKQDADLQALLRNPASLRATLLKNGASRIGTATLKGVPVEGFASSNYRRKGEKIKVWLRRSDALPLQLEWSDKSTQAKVTWSNYRKSADSARLRALFVAPKDYKLRDTSRPTTLVPGLM